MIKSLIESLSTSLRIGLSKNGITLLRISGWRQSQCQLLSDVALSSEASMGPTQIAAELGKLITETGCSGLPAAVIIADEWVRFFVVTPPKNCNRIEDCYAAANMRFQTLYGEAVNDWYIDANWDPQHPFMACALPRSLRSVLQQVAADHRLTLTSVLPQFIAAWNLWHRRLTSNSWFGIAHNSQLTLGIIDQQRLCGVRTTFLPEHAWSDQRWLPEYVLREAMRLNVQATTSLQLCGEIPGQWTTHTIGALSCIRLDSTHQTSTQVELSESLILARSGLQQ